MSSSRMFRVVALTAVLGVAPWACAQTPPAWSVNAWGGRPTVVSAEVDENRCGAGGFLFSKTRQGDGDAELLFPGALKPGVAYRFSLRVKRLAGQGWLDLSFRKSGPHYETTSVRSLMPRAEPEVLVLEGIYDAAGPGAVRVGLRSEGLVVCLSSPRLETISRDEVGDGRASHAVPSTFFGIHLNKLGSHNGWPSFDPDIVRMWDTGTTWADLQPEPGPIEWTRNVHAQRFDYFAVHMRRFNPKATMLVTLGMTPAWAAARMDGGCASAAYGARSCTPPADMDYWRQYVRGLAVRYKGRARHWEVLNESDVPMHWAGSVQQLVEMTRIAREELKAVDPGNVVMGPNVTSLGLRLLNDFLRLGGGAYIDAVSVHAYIGRTPNLALTKLRNVQELVKGWGLNLPIWNTEAGLSCTPDVDCDALLSGRSPMDGVSALAQAYVGQAALGIKNVSYHTWEGGVIEGGGLPLVQRDYSTPTPAGSALETLKKWMAGAQASWLSTMDERVRRVALVKAERSCTVAWVDAGEATLPALQLSGARTAVDALDRAVAPQSEGYRIGTLPVMGCTFASGKTLP